MRYSINSLFFCSEVECKDKKTWLGRMPNAAMLMMVLNWEMVLFSINFSRRCLTVCLLTLTCVAMLV
mgnify:CR=1 FL=1